MSTPLPVEADAARDERLACLLGELSEQLHQGRQPDVDAVARQYPDLADELRQLWATVQFAAALARPIAASRPPSPLTAPPPAAPRSFGDYEILEELGRGGMGVVYKARQKSLDRLVALKMILRGELASAAGLARFRSEAESAARLEHPNIVPVHEVGECDGQPYFSMQYVEGRTLADLLADGPLPPREAARLLAVICRAVHYAHQRGILHRDLKPSNILLAVRSDPLQRVGGAARPAEAGHYEPMVTDFGLAKRVTAATGTSAVASLTQSGAILGTPSYMAPEQAAGSRGVLSPASDVYSLGTILYEMLTGRPPFRAASPVDTIMLVLEQEPVPPRLLNPGVDRELEMICLKCLQKPADLRYPTAAQLADDLEAFLRGEPTSARPSGLGYYFSRLLRETHHAAVLENWGLLWMWHSLALLVLCVATGLMQLLGVADPGWYVLLWGAGLGTWAAIFWLLRRRGGPVTFVERQIAHVWAASTFGSMMLFLVELLLRLPVLTLSPVLAVKAGMVFLAKAGTLSGTFYVYAAASFLTAVAMAFLTAAGLPWLGLFLFGVVSAAGFFFPGLKYHRQRLGRANLL